MGLEWLGVIANHFAVGNLVQVAHPLHVAFLSQNRKTAQKQHFADSRRFLLDNNPDNPYPLHEGGEVSPSELRGLGPKSTVEQVVWESPPPGLRGYGPSAKASGNRA